MEAADGSSPRPGCTPHPGPRPPHGGGSGERRDDVPATETSRGRPDPPAAGLFALGAFLLLRYDDRRLWAVGLVLQVLVFAVYLAVAPEREPAFEPWGVLLRVLQVGLAVPLALLTFRRASWLAERAR